MPAAWGRQSPERNQRIQEREATVTELTDGDQPVRAMRPTESVERHAGPKNTTAIYRVPGADARLGNLRIAG